MDKILVAEDDESIREELTALLRANGYQTVDAPPCDLALLDVNLPDESGFELCRKLRMQSDVPVIFLTARVSSEDEIIGFGVGADDYVTKPFDPIEVQARVRSQLRRYTRLGGQAKREQPKDTITIGGVELNDAEKSVTVDGEPVQLTPIEFSILWYLCENQGRVVSSEELFEAVWGEKFLDNNNTVMAHIGRLREKLCEPPRKPRFIKTVWGVGYQIE